MFFDKLCGDLPADLDTPMQWKDDFESDATLPICFICFDNQYQYYGYCSGQNMLNKCMNRHEFPTSLKFQTYYQKLCECDGQVHINCLHQWYESKHTCPICCRAMASVSFCNNSRIRVCCTKIGVIIQIITNIIIISLITGYIVINIVGYMSWLLSS